MPGCDSPISSVLRNSRFALNSDSGRSNISYLENRQPFNAISLAHLRSTRSSQDSICVSDTINRTMNSATTRSKSDAAKLRNVQWYLKRECQQSYRVSPFWTSIDAYKFVFPAIDHVDPFKPATAASISLPWPSSTRTEQPHQ